MAAYVFPHRVFVHFRFFHVGSVIAWRDIPWLRLGLHVTRLRLRLGLHIAGLLWLAGLNLTGLILLRRLAGRCPHRLTRWRSDLTGLILLRRLTSRTHLARLGLGLLAHWLGIDGLAGLNNCRGRRILPRGGCRESG